MLSAQDVVEGGWITNYDKDSAVQQHGIDLRIKGLSVLDRETWGIVPTKGKTSLPIYREIYCNHNGNWVLDPGYHQVVFMEGMKVPNDKMCLLVQRSSVASCGIWLHSSVFDAGYWTDYIGSFMMVFHRTVIEPEARICQALFYDTKTILNTYHGDYMNTGLRSTI
jgi:dUTP pyrophosphatase